MHDLVHSTLQLKRTAMGQHAKQLSQPAHPQPGMAVPEHDEVCLQATDLIVQLLTSKLRTPLPTDRGKSASGRVCLRQDSMPDDWGQCATPNGQSSQQGTTAGTQTCCQHTSAAELQVS
jgi:hypothetical protein